MKKRKTPKNVPFVIYSIWANSLSNWGVSPIIYEKAKRDYPQYWNNIGEFDPCFEHRNVIVNFFRKLHSDWRMRKIRKNLVRYAETKYPVRK